MHAISVCCTPSNWLPKFWPTCRGGAETYGAKSKPRFGHSLLVGSQTDRLPGPTGIRAMPEAPQETIANRPYLVGWSGWNKLPSHARGTAAGWRSSISSGSNADDRPLSVGPENSTGSSEIRVNRAVCSSDVRVACVMLRPEYALDRVRHNQPGRGQPHPSVAWITSQLRATSTALQAGPQWGRTSRVFNRRGGEPPS